MKRPALPERGRQVKRCTTCGDTKPLGDFTRRTSSRDGLNSSCRLCTAAAVRASAARRRAKMGDEVFREHHRMAEARARLDPAYRERGQLATRARYRALEALAIRHEEEFERLVERERGLLGLPPRYGQSRRGA